MRLPLLFLTSLLILSGQAAQANENRLTDNCPSSEEWLLEGVGENEKLLQGVASPSLQLPISEGPTLDGGTTSAAIGVAADGVAGESTNKECGAPSLCGLPQGNDGDVLQDVQKEAVNEELLPENCGTALQQEFLRRPYCDMGVNVDAGRIPAETEAVARQECNVFLVQKAGAINETSQNESLAIAQCGEGPQLVQQGVVCTGGSAAEGNTRIASGRGHIKPVAHQRFVASAANGQPNVESATAQPKPVKKPHPIARKVRAFCSFMAPIVNVTVGVLTILLLLL